MLRFVTGVGRGKKMQLKFTKKKKTSAADVFLPVTIICEYIINKPGVLFDRTD